MDPVDVGKIPCCLGGCPPDKVLNTHPPKALSPLPFSKCLQFFFSSTPSTPSISRHRIHLWIEAYTSFPNRGWRREDDTGHPRSMVVMSFHHAWLPTCTLLPWLLPHSRYVQWPGLFLVNHSLPTKVGREVLYILVYQQTMILKYHNFGRNGRGKNVFIHV